MNTFPMVSSLAFLYATRSFPCCFADSAERSLSINTDEKQELFISFFLFSQTQSLSILETKRTKIGCGRGGRDVPSLDSVESSLLTALFGFPVRCIAWNIIFSGPCYILLLVGLFSFNFVIPFLFSCVYLKYPIKVKTDLFFKKVIANRSLNAVYC